MTPHKHQSVEWLVANWEKIGPVEIEWEGLTRRIVKDPEVAWWSWEDCIYTISGDLELPRPPVFPLQVLGTVEHVLRERLEAFGNASICSPCGEPGCSLCCGLYEVCVFPKCVEEWEIMEVAPTLIEALWLACEATKGMKAATDK
jgi:hypothetical protein